MNYEYDEEYEYYVCSKNLDEDEMYRFVRGRIPGLSILSVRRRVPDCEEADIIGQFLY